MRTPLRAAVAVAIATAALTGCATKSEDAKEPVKAPAKERAADTSDKGSSEVAEAGGEPEIDMDKVSDECAEWVTGVEKAMSTLNTEDPDADQAIAGLEAIRKDAPEEIRGDIDTLVRWAREVLPMVEEMQRAAESGVPPTPEQMAKAQELAAQQGASEEVTRAAEGIQAYLADKCGMEVPAGEGATVEGSPGSLGD